MAAFRHRNGKWQVQVRCKGQPSGSSQKTTLSRERDSFKKGRIHALLVANQNHSARQKRYAHSYSYAQTLALSLKRHAQTNTSTVQRLPCSGFTRHTRIGVSVVRDFDRTIQPHLHKGRACGRCRHTA